MTFCGMQITIRGESTSSDIYEGREILIHIVYTSVIEKTKLVRNSTLDCWGMQTGLGVFLIDFKCPDFAASLLGRQSADARGKYRSIGFKLDVRCNQFLVFLFFRFF